MRPFKRRYVKRLVKLYGKKNGIVKSCWFDSPIMEIQYNKDKHLINAKALSKHELLKMMDE